MEILPNFSKLSTQKKVDLKPPLSNTGANCKTVTTERSPQNSETIDAASLEVPAISTKLQGDENYTPDWFISIVTKFLGKIDLDFFSCDRANQTVKAAKYFTSQNSALDNDCSSYLRKFANPPYSRGLIDKCVDRVLEFSGIGETVLLVNTATSVRWYKRAMSACVAYCFPKRIQFDSPYRDPADKARNRYEQTIFYYGDRVQEFCEVFSAIGEIGLPYRKKDFKSSFFKPIQPTSAQELQDNLQDSVSSKQIYYYSVDKNLSPQKIEEIASLTLPDTSASLPFNYAGGIDWIQGVFPNISKSEFDCIRGEIESIFKDSFDDKDIPKFSGRQFHHGIRSSRSAHLAWNDLEGQPNRCEVWLSIPSGVLVGCPHIHLILRFIRQLDKLRFRPTRLDLCLDDYTKSLSFRLFEATYDANLHHGFDDLWEYRKKKKGIHAGRTLYLGSPSADKMLRLYEKFLESDGEIDSIRLEAQLKDEYCRDAWVYLNRATEATFTQVCVNIVINCIDFYSGDRKDKKRCVWWQEFHDLVNASKIKLSSGRAKNSIERSMNWVSEGGVARVLATIQEFYEHTTSDFYEWLDAQLKLGASKMNSSHFAQIKAACSLQSIEYSISRDNLIAGFF